MNLKTYIINLILKRIMRGNIILKNAGRLKSLTCINDELTVTPILKHGAFSKEIFGAGLGQAELIVRQYLLTKLAGLLIVRFILFAEGCKWSKIICPFPSEWRKVAEKQGFKINSLLSIMLWDAIIILQFVRGIITLFSFYVTLIKNTLIESKVTNQNYVFFNNLSGSILPKSYDACVDGGIISAYLNRFGPLRNGFLFCHSVKTAPKIVGGNWQMHHMRNQYDLPIKGRLLVQFILKSFSLVFVSLFSLIQGNWCNTIILPEAIKALFFRVCPTNLIGTAYLFHNSDYIYRPLWTYETASKGSSIILYFYSTNCEPFDRFTERQVNALYGYNAMSWPIYWTWDKFQSDFVKRVACGTFTTKNMGPITLYGGQELTRKLPNRSIAIFDVIPQRDTFYYSLGVTFDYYKVAMVIQFYMDLYDVLEPYDYTIVFKNKRQLGNLTHPSFKSFIEYFSKRERVIQIDAEISAESLIKACDPIISIPFTSTAVIAKYLKKHAFYYDPSGLINKKDRAAHDIQVISGKKELVQWAHSEMPYLTY